MWLKRRQLISATCGMFLSSRSHCAPKPNADFLSDVHRKFQVPALVAACVQGGKLVFVGATGVCKQGSDEPVTSDDAFHIGSCTKAMTATMLAMLVEQGKLAWDMSIADAFPELTGKLHPAFHSVTLLQLLLHRAGLPDDTQPDLEIFPRLRKLKGAFTEQRRTLLELVLSRPPAYTPGERMVYSNYGYVVAAAMAEAVTKRTWEKLMQTLLFEPLKMTTVGFGAPQKVWGHQHRMGRCQPVKPSPEADNPLVLAPAGGVHCSVKDWAKFATLHLRGAQGKSSLLSSESFRHLHTDRYRQGYALGWLVTQREWAKGTALTHAGSNTLWFAVIWLAPNCGAGFLAATNCGGEHAFRACDAAIAAMVQRFL